MKRLITAVTALAVVTPAVILGTPALAGAWVVRH